MNQKALSRWLKGIVLGMGVCGLILYFLVIPIAGDSLVVQYPEFSGPVLAMDDLSLADSGSLLRRAFLGLEHR